MLKFNLVEETSKKIVYEYYPEGANDDAGVVSYDKELKKNSIVILSAKDKHQRYAQKMFARIREFANSNSFEKEGTIAWY